jgi:hypothetical protein
LLHSYFQVSPDMFNRVQVRALAGPLKDIQRLVSKPLLSCLGCVLRIVVLVEGEPSPQSENLLQSTRDFIKDLSVLCFVHLSLNPQSPSPYRCVIPSTSWLSFCCDMHFQLWDLIDRRVPFQIMSNQLNLPQMDSKL